MTYGLSKRAISDDLKRPIASFSYAIFRTTVQQLTRFQLTARRAVPLR